MGMTNVAAVMAALLAGVLIALSLATGSPGDPQAHRPAGATGSSDLQAGYSVRGQAWATELFGRRYGRHLMAAAAPVPGDGEATA